ncbi:protein YgfX [Nitrosococcus oceani]|uniref:Toxin CptA n=1 Tax=Nitrosococcus oceani C-27 TaxID=314279 RepID=A0A0E2Z0J6_9GAMM|nr:protein YgfX [Nitrosococcus oceani]EDZ67956.1 hypothetical protein NOC27_1283 [Nitrosococcus oceani AFC27]KFI18721.1 hypothetical protein IB75_13130 [Nitrosococcus oceani C-27]KFI21839.1 hypothetical protein HW44_12650 [Nitrosococcus oceani]
MSSPKYAAPLYLKRYPSRTLVVYLVAVHGGVLALLPRLALSWELSILLSSAVIASFYLSLRGQALLLSSKAVVQIFWDSDNVWYLRRRNGREYIGKLLPGCFVGSRLVVLNFVLGAWWQRTSVVLLSDNVDPESLRRLRVRLRISCS